METNSQITVGTCIRELRKNKGMSINDLVRLSEISKGYISQIENNKFIPSPEILEKLAIALEVSHLYLLEEAGHYKGSDTMDMLQMILGNIDDQRKYKEIELQHVADGGNKEAIEEIRLEIKKLNEEFENTLELVEKVKRKNVVHTGSKKLKINRYEDPDILTEEIKSKNISNYKKRIELGNLFESENEITIDGKTLTDEEKKKALQILKLTFDK